MFFASDNSGPAHPKVMDAMMRANEGYRFGYGADPEMDRVRTMVRDLVVAPAVPYIPLTLPTSRAVATSLHCV